MPYAPEVCSHLLGHSVHAYAAAVSNDLKPPYRHHDLLLKQFAARRRLPDHVGSRRKRASASRWRMVFGMSCAYGRRTSCMTHPPSRAATPTSGRPSDC